MDGAMRWMLVAMTMAIVFTVAAADAVAQVPVVTSFSPAMPVGVTYVPERRGLFGQRIVYRPVITTQPVVGVAAAPVVAQRVAVGRAPTVVGAPVVVQRPVVFEQPVVVQRPSFAPVIVNRPAIPVVTPLFGF